MLARGIMQVTGGPWEVVAPLLALVLGAGAVLVIHRTVVRGAPRAVARARVSRWRPSRW